MAWIEIDGVGIEYELLGENGPTIALTPGGRFSKDSAGLHELARALVVSGRRVLLSDRPNCGASDLSFDAVSESELHGRTLVKLARALKLTPITLAGGSAGSRVSMIAASRDPEAVARLALWWISGGPLGLMQLALFYCGESAFAASKGGMDAVTKLQCWVEQITRNPRNRDYLLSQDTDAFIAKMQDWATSYLPNEGSPIPGMSPENFASITMPTLLFRNGKSDLSHTYSTSNRVNQLIPRSVLIDAPWPDTEWNDRAAAAQTEGRGLFEGWIALAPSLLAFTADDHTEGTKQDLENALMDPGRTV